MTFTFTFARPVLVLVWLSLLANAHASLWGDDVRNHQCRAAINDALHLFGPSTASGRPIVGIPQKCAFLFPGRNAYNREEKVIGSFIAPDCGVCAAACVASYENMDEDKESVGFYLQDEVMDKMTPSAVQNFKDLMMKSRSTCTACTDWVYCSPEVSVTTTGLKQVSGNETYYIPEDPAFGTKCTGRYVDGEMQTYGEGYRGYGPDLCLVKSTTGCNNPSPDRKVPAGTCTLKAISKTKVLDHFPPKIADMEHENAYIGSQDYDMWDYEYDKNDNGRWAKTNSKWNGVIDQCPDQTLPYPVFTAEDVKDCPGIDPKNGIFMSGMCNWTPGIASTPVKTSCKTP